MPPAAASADDRKPVLPAWITPERVTTVGSVLIAIGALLNTQQGLVTDVQRIDARVDALEKKNTLTDVRLAELQGDQKVILKAVEGLEKSMARLERATEKTAEKLQ